MGLTLPERPAQYFIDEVLLPAWDPADARGFDVTVGDPDAAAFLPVARTIDNVGAVYPSLIVQYSNETSGGESTYDFMTADGPGQNRSGTLLATVRAQDDQRGYTGDSAAYDAVDADDIVGALTDAVESVVARNAAGGDTEFQTLGSQRGPDVPDDTEEDPPVRLSQVEIRYSWVRRP